MSNTSSEQFYRTIEFLQTAQQFHDIFVSQYQEKLDEHLQDIKNVNNMFQTERKKMSDNDKTRILLYEVERHVLKEHEKNNPQYEMCDYLNDLLSQQGKLFEKGNVKDQQNDTIPVLTYRAEYDPYEIRSSKKPFRGYYSDQYPVMKEKNGYRIRLDMYKVIYDNELSDHDTNYRLIASFMFHNENLNMIRVQNFNSSKEIIGEQFLTFENDGIITEMQLPL